MHFDQRTQRALQEVGLSADGLREAAALVVEYTQADADRIESFFEGLETIHSDMDLAHGSADTVEHDLEYLDLFTHADDIRGYLRFDTWGVPVVGGRVLEEDVVELTLGPTVDDRVRFAADRDAL